MNACLTLSDICTTLVYKIRVSDATKQMYIVVSITLAPETLERAVLAE